MSEKYTKEFLLRELAVRASFTLGDVKILWEEFEKLVEEVIAEKDELMIGGLFKIYMKEIAPHTAFDISTQKHKTTDTTYRLVISPSTTLRRIARYGRIDKTSPPDEEE